MAMSKLDNSRHASHVDTASSRQGRPAGSGLNRIVLWLLVMTMLGGASWIAWRAWQEANQAAWQSRALTEKLEVMEKVSLKGKKVLETITFSWYDGYSEAVNELKALRLSAEHHRQAAARYARIFVAIILLVLVVTAAYPRPGLMLLLLGLSLIALLAGLLMPVFSLVASRDFPVLGQTVFQYESKSILGALHKLWSQGQTVIAAIIVLFTVLVPLLKTGLMATLLSLPHKAGHPRLRKAHQALLHLGKWSMLDVFLVAIVVAWFSLRDKGSTDAQIQAGLYFFLVYVLLSMLIAAVLTRFLPRNCRHSLPSPRGDN